MYPIKELRLTIISKTCCLVACPSTAHPDYHQARDSSCMFNHCLRLILMSLIITNGYWYHIHAFIISNWTLTCLYMTALCHCVWVSVCLCMLTMASALCSQVHPDTLIHTCHQTCIELFIQLWGGRGHSALVLTKSESASNQDCQLHWAKEALC